MRIVVAIIFAASVFCSFATSALAFCSQPDAPSCATRYGNFDDQDDFDRCKRQMASYQSDVESFLNCNNEEAKNVNEAAISDYDAAVNSFNRRARQ